MSTFKKDDIQRIENLAERVEGVQTPNIKNVLNAETLRGLLG